MDYIRFALESRRAFVVVAVVDSVIYTKAYKSHMGEYIE